MAIPSAMMTGFSLVSRTNGRALSSEMRDGTSLTSKLTGTGVHFGPSRRT